MPERDRIAVTGFGVVSALGCDATTTFRRLVSGERGISRVSLFDVEGQRGTLAAEVPGLRVADVAPPGELTCWSRSDALALVAAREALACARFSHQPPRLSIAVGGTTGGMYEAEGVLRALSPDQSRESVDRLLSYPLSTTADRLARAFGAARALTVCSACSSSAIALVQGASWLLQGDTDAALVGGTDGLCSLTFTGFNALGAMDAGPCRPFDTARSGLSLGEGSAFLVLEKEAHARRRGATIHALFTGFAVAAEAHHLTHPEPSGATAARLLALAMTRAGLSRRDVDYVNAHGTGTIANDAMEARALRTALDEDCERIWISSSKGQVGHTLGAAGAVEAVFTVMSLVQQVVPPTGGLSQPDPNLPLRHVIGSGIPTEVRAALSNSFGFGGTGCVLAFERADAPERPNRKIAAERVRRTVITGAATLGPLGRLCGLDNAAYLEPSIGEQARALPLDPIALLEPERSRRFDRSTALVTACAQSALADSGTSAAEAGIVSGTAFGNVERCVEFLTRVAERGPRFANPAEFPHLVPSSAAGNASIYLGARGPVVTVSDLSTTPEAAFVHATALLDAGCAHAIALGSAETLDAIVCQVIAPLCERPQSSDRSEGSGFVVLETEEHAEQRSARQLARVTRVVHTRDGLEAALRGVAAPRDVSRAWVVSATAAAELHRVVDATPWAAAERRCVAVRAGWHEAIGGIVLAAAAAALARGECDEALVCAWTNERAYALHLSRAAEPEHRRYAAG
jgi:3-oxoacyl-[acyl-carrier-protein] synthase II